MGGGGDPQILLVFYKSFIRGIIDYGSSLYANTPESTLTLMDRVQNQGLKLLVALRTTKTTPIPALQSEANVLPLLLRSIHLAKQYVLRTVSNSTNEFTSLLFNFPYLKIQKTISFVSRIILELKPLNHSSYIVDRYPYKNSNAASSQVSHKIRPTQPLCNSRRILHIYTNAPKTNDRCSIAFYSPHNPEIQSQLDIPELFSVYMAHFLTIYLSLRCVLEHFTHF